MQSLFPINEILKGLGDTRYHKYQADPVGFGQEILGEVYTDDVKRMMESVRDNPITIARSANATGKTHAAARVAVWFKKAYPSSKVFTAAAPPIDNLELLLWGEIGDIVRSHKDLFANEYITKLKISDTPPISEIGRDEAWEDSDKKVSLLKGLTIPSAGTEKDREAKFSGKHAPHMLFVLDEGDAIPDEVYRGIESCMSGGFCRLLIMFNPRKERGEAYRMERDNRAHVVTLHAFSHPNVQTGREVIPGAVTCETTVRRINEWCRPLQEGEAPDPDSREFFKLPAFLEHVEAQRSDGGMYPPLQPGWYQVTENSFYYMVLGEYPLQASDQLISRDWVNAARLRYDLYVSKHGVHPPELVPARGGFDVADQGDDENCLCFRYGGFVEPLLHWKGMDLPTSEDRVVNEVDRRRLEILFVDGTGVGAGCAPHLVRRSVFAVKVMVAQRATVETDLGSFGILNDQLAWMLREWLRADPYAMLPPDELLIEELLCPTYVVEKGRVRIMPKKIVKENIGRSPDRFDALKLTFAEGVAENVNQRDNRNRVITPKSEAVKAKLRVLKV